MKQKITFFALTGKCRRAAVASTGEAALVPSAISEDNATIPNPFAAVASISRRVTGRAQKPGQFAAGLEELIRMLLPSSDF